MNAQRLLALYERIADAPDAVGRLRRFVLDLAVRGKLAAQDDRDDLVSDLILRISEVQELQEQNGRKKSNRRDVSHQFPPFKVPATWKWVLLGKVARIRTGKLDANAAVKGGRYPFFTCSQTPSTIDSYSFDTAAVLLAGNGDFNLKSFTGKFDAYQRTYVIEPSNWQLAYCFIVIRSQIDRITDNQRGSAIPYLKLADIADLFIPLPPLAEQHRIVAKVDELMALCDRLEAARAQRESTRDRLAAASLARLNAPDPDTFRDDARFSLDALPALTTRPDQIKQLRQTILNLAVRGKLVAQDPGDEPAQLLLARLGEAIDAWTPGPKSATRADTGSISEEPFDLPAGWTWARFLQLGKFGRGKSRHRPRNDPALYEGGTHFVVQTGDVARSSGLVETYTGKYNDVGLAQSHKWPAGTLCITIAANIADSGILSFDACFPDSVVGFVPHPVLGNSRYFEFFVRTAKANLLEFAPATAQKNINLEILNQVRIPLPPLNEIHRIVARVDELMALCDQLEASLAQGDTARRRLLDALLTEALAPAVVESKSEPALA
jgi:type I restriction enzyme S subunit